VQNKTYFEDKQDGYFIPKTAKTCTADAAGCDQFTNLDEVAKGGEGIEYYTTLRQCIKPNTPGKICGEYYSWEGSDESGYQLKVESLEANSAGDNSQPVTTSYDSSLCDATIYNSPASDPRHNDDCRQYYNRGGGVFYLLHSATKDCIDNCHPYRRTAQDDTAGNCQAHGGEWSSEYSACIYMSVPNEGATCSAAQNGCREYTGNTGNNVKNIFTDDFSDSTVGSWAGSVTPSSESVTLGPDNKGHSINITTSAWRPVGTSVIQGKSYVLNFLAKSVGATNLTVELGNGTVTSIFTATLALTTDWKIYQINLASLDHAVSANEALLLTANASFYISNITLTEITDRYYLIKNSWQTPDSCYNDMSGVYQGPLYNLGCSQYTDQVNKNYYLKQFSRLCSESSVGCEKMIDTHNSSSTEEVIFTNSGTTVTVPADNEIYAVYDQTKTCDAAQKGCALLGKAYKYENTTLYGDVYLKNNPDNYNTTLCGAGAVGCQTFVYNNGASDNGEKYFKDPGDQICEWRRAANQGESYGWYKKKVKRCGGDGGTVCLADTDCSAGVICQPEIADIDCPTSNSKTLGVGGVGGLVSQPGEDSNGKWAGVCAASESGCTEYLDPVSKFNTNLIFNGSFQTIASGPTDGWNSLSQDIILEPNTVYRLARTADAGSLTLSGCTVSDALFVIDQNNNLTGPVSLVKIDMKSYANSKNFYYRSNSSASCTITAGKAAGTVELKPVVIDYQLSQNINSTGCNGAVDFDKGCVLFNQRNQNGSGLAKLTFDANTANGSPADSGTENSNVILKVAPDRVCDKWLACRSYIKDEKGNNVCFDVGLCDAVDDKGDCSDFLTSSKVNQTIGVAGQLGADDIGNLSGYAKVGIGVGSLTNDYYPLGAMAQMGEVANLSNGGFEFYGSNNYPVGWNPTGGAWDVGKFSVINNPVTAQAEGVKYPVEGESFLKFSPSADSILSEFIDVEPNTEYFVSFKINTSNFHTGAGFDWTAAGVGIMTFNAAGEAVNLAGKSPSHVDISLCNGEDANSPWVNGCAVTTASGSKGWEEKIFSFKVGGDTHRIKLYLYGHIWWGSNECNISSGGSCKWEGTNNACVPSHGCIVPAGTVVSSPCGWGDTITMTSDACAGNVYLDDIKIRPSLESKCLETDGKCSNKSSYNAWHTLQNCRLYPKSDSLSCDYYEDSGNRQKGWYGYCLEYDRAPGNPNACLLWYPVDKVKGDGVEDSAGYQGKMPVYYTLEAKAKRAYEYRHVYKSQTASTEGCKASSCPAGYKPLMIWCSNESGNDPTSCVCEPSGQAITLDDSKNNYSGTANLDCTGSYGYEVNDPVGEADGWYEYDGVFSGASYVIGSDNKFVEELCGNTTGCTKNSELFRTKLYTTTLVQTVSSVGQNKYWSSRVYKGSSYKVPNSNFSYDSDSAPFGSMVIPQPANNPYEWDGDSSKLNNQPIYYNTPASGVARSGQAYSCIPSESDDCLYVVDPSAQDYYPYKYFDISSRVGIDGTSEIKRLFAQSYGVYTWSGTEDDGRYVSTSTRDWSPPNTACNGTGLAPRPAYPGDLCGVKPVVNNIKVNGVSSDIIFNKNGFANLTFNTVIDGDQLPMVMYSVDWGDGEKTVVSGVEMRDRPNQDNPHSLYHLYSYWDLKAKANRGVPGVNCSIPGECKVQPRIQIKDNWGWCNDGLNCKDWIWFNKYITVREK